MQVSPKKKKRKFKRGFKITLFIIFILIVGIIVFLYLKKNNFEIAKLNPFKKEKLATTTEIMIEPSVLSISADNSITTDDSNIVADDAFSKLFALRLPSQNLTYASSSEISSNGDMKIFLKNTHNDSGYLFVNTKNDASYVWITFVSAIAGEPLKSSLTNNLKNLNYIDLRFGNKIFYKFTGASSPTTISNSSSTNSTTSTTTR